jgi:hypothetical protein
MALSRGQYFDTYKENEGAQCSTVVPIGQEMVGVDFYRSNNQRDLKSAVYLMQWMGGRIIFYGRMWKGLRMFAVRVMKLGIATLRVRIGMVKTVNLRKKMGIVKTLKLTKM